MELNKPLISIITPCNKTIPWFNARLINICSQSFKNWEWIILDNSKDGCVKKYVDDFFTSMQGIYYPECRDKIHCTHNPFDGLEMEKGRMGVLRNECIRMTHCDDNGWIFVFDSDDFIYDGFLEAIADINEKYPFSEAISGMNVLSLMQFTKSGGFSYHYTAYQWVNKLDTNSIAVLRNSGFDGIGFDDYAERYHQGKMLPTKIVDCNSELTIPYVNLTFKFDTATSLDDKGYPLITGFGHPIVYKKGAFLKKIGGYHSFGYVEDMVTCMMPFLLNNPVYIKRPVYIQCAMIDDDTLFRDSVSRNTGFENMNAVWVDCIEKNYNALGDCRRTIVPIWYE